MMSQSVLNVYFIRHAQSQFNAEAKDLVGGQNLKAELTNIGRNQAKLLGKHLKNIGIRCDIAFSSHARRTQDTAAIILDKIGYNECITIDKNLIEYYAGDWEGKPSDIYNRADVKEKVDKNNWMFVPGDIVKGESQNDIADRMITFLLKIVNDYLQYPSIKNIFVFSHGSAIKYMLAKFCRLHLPTAFKMSINNTGVTVLRFKDGDWINPLKLYDNNIKDVDVLTYNNGDLVYSDDLWNNIDHLR